MKNPLVWSVVVWVSYGLGGMNEEALWLLVLTISIAPWALSASSEDSKGGTDGNA